MRTVRHREPTKSMPEVDAPAMALLAGAAVVAAAVAALAAQMLIDAADRDRVSREALPTADVMRRTLPWGL